METVIINSNVSKGKNMNQIKEFVEIIDRIIEKADPFTKGCVFGLVDGIFSMKDISVILEKRDHLKFGNKFLSGYELLVKHKNGELLLKRVLIVEDDTVVAYVS